MNSNKVATPTPWRRPFSTLAVDTALNLLALNGSSAAPGFMKPEGIVIFHKAGSYLFKKTIEKDEEPKGHVKETHHA